MCVDGHQHSVDVELKELFLGGADSCGNGSRNDRTLQSSRWLRGFCATPNEELVINIRRTNGMKSETGIAPKVSSFR